MHARIHVLLCSFVFAAVVVAPLAGQDAATKAVKRQVVLRPSTGTDGGVAAWESLLAREIGRQALLMAARDQLGLTTRDLLLREGDRQAADDEGRLIDVRFSPVMGSNLIALVRQLQRESRKTLVDKKTSLGQSLPMPYKPLLDFAEKLSRREYVDGLKKAGFTGEPLKADESVPVPEKTQRLLARMSIPAQFAAIRQLHAISQKQGFSKEVLGALVRGYANLSMFAELHWSSSHDVLKARALLYAHRMRVSNDGPHARWHRAYALAIAGLHADALHDIAAAKKMIAEGKPTPEATVAKSPDWLPLVEAVCRFETDKHEFVPEKTIDDYELAALLATRNAELTKITPFMETSLFDPTKYDPVRKFAAELPHCWRIGEAVHITTNSDLHDADAAAMRSQLAATFYSELDRIEDLPRSVKAIIAEQVKSDDATEAAEYRTRAALLAALYEAGDADNLSEPSWSMLAMLLEDTTFAWCHCQAADSDRLDEDARADLLELYEPMLARHPYREVLQIHGINWSLRRESYLSVLESIDVANITYWGRSTYRNFPNNEIIKKFQDAANRHRSDNYPGLVDMSREVTPDFRDDMGNQLLTVSPHAPLAVALKIETDWKNVKKHAAEWEARYADELPVMRALGLAYYSEGKNKDAIRCLKRFSDVIHDYVIYQTMAKAFRKEKDTKGLLAMWEEACRVSYNPQMLSQCRTAWLQSLMDVGRFSAAIEAADVMQNPDLGIIALAAEGAEYQRDMTEADKRFKKLYELAPDSWSNVLWWAYCARTKRDDLDAASQAAEAFIAANEEEDRFGNSENQSVAGRTALIMGQKERGAALLAAAQLQQLRIVDAWHQLLVAVEDKDEKAVAEIVDRFKSEGEGAIKPGMPVTKKSVEIAKLVGDSMAKGKPLVEKAVKDLLASATPDESVRMKYFAGRYYEATGDTAAAKSWYRESAKIPRGCLERTAACLRLRELGEEPNDIKVGPE